MARATKLNPGQNMPTNQLVEAAVEQLKQGRFDAAESRLATLARQFPNNARVLALHGDALRQLERTADAVAAYRRAFEAGLQTPELLLNLAACHNKESQFDEAQVLAERVLQNQPQHAGALSIMGDAMRKRGQLAQARDYLRRALAVQPRDANLFKSIAHLDTFTADSPVFEVLEADLQKGKYGASEQANILATLGKASLDIGADKQAFDYYQRANATMDASLPPIKAELERLLAFTRDYFTAPLFEQLSPHAEQSRPQIIVAGMSRSGKSLVESLFRGVEGVSLAGEDLVISRYRKDALEANDKKMDAWLADLTPDAVSQDSKEYLKRLQELGDDGAIKITTVPGDLWNLGLIGLWAPKVPIIFCVRNVLDLGITGYFQQYLNPEGYRYSYDLHQMGRQIACFEKVMEHWAQVLPNPVYLVDYEALVRDPQTVMNNLLSDLGLERKQDYADGVSANAAVLDTISPIVSHDGPLPITDRFIGISERFLDRLTPMIKGYHTIVDEFPRREPPVVFPHPLPETLVNTIDEGPAPSEATGFTWQLSGQMTVLDNGSLLLRANKVKELLALGSFGLVSFDPMGDVQVDPELQDNDKLQLVQQAMLGNGQDGTVYVCLDEKYTGTLPPLPPEQLPSRLRQPASVLAKLPIKTFALDSIEGLGSLDWLLLDGGHDSLAILQHGQTAMANTLLVQVGISFQPIWQRQASMDEISHWGARNGFRFYRLVGIKSGQCMDARPDLLQQPQPTELQAANMLLVPDEARMAALDDAQRLKLAFILDTVYKVHDLSYQLLHEIGAQLGDNYLKARGFFDRKRHGPSGSQLGAVRRALYSGGLFTQTDRVNNWSRQYPRDPQVQRIMAETSSWSGHAGQAMHLLRKAMENAPEDLGIRLSGVEILLRGGLWWEAGHTINGLLQRQPDNAAVRMLGWEALAAHPAPEPPAVQQALEAIEADNLHTLEEIAQAGTQPGREPEDDAALGLANTANGTHDSEGSASSGFTEGGAEEAEQTSSVVHVPRAAQPDSKYMQAAHKLSLRARLLAHSGQFEQSLQLHDKALEVLGDLHGPVRARLHMAKSASQQQAGLVDDSCRTMWQACATYPFTPYTQHAYRKLTQALEQSQGEELRGLGQLHQEIQRIWAGYKGENLQYSFGDFNLPYQGFEPLMLPGTRPAMHRLGVYEIENELPPGARALDIGCNHGFLLTGLAPHLSYGLGFDISQSCIDVGSAVAKYLGHEHIELSSKPFDEFRCKKPFDLVIACAVHRWIGVPLPEFGAKLYSYCKPGGIVLVESQGIRSTTKTEPDFDEKVTAIADAGFSRVRKGSLCDDGINYREFWVLKRQ